MNAKYLFQIILNNLTLGTSNNNNYKLEMHIRKEFTIKLIFVTKSVHGIMSNRQS